jgi:hypothetical protein
MENRTPFDLNEAIRRWQQNLGASPALNADDLEELASHLRALVQKLQADGLSEEEAFLAAVTTKYPINCCPVCGNPVGSKRYFWRAWIWARWNCQSCGTLLRFDFHRRLLFTLFMGVFFILTLGIEVLCLVLRIPNWIWYIPLLVIFILGMIFAVCRANRVIAAEPATKAGAESGDCLGSDREEMNRTGKPFVIVVLS